MGVTKAVSDRFGKGGIADRMIWFNGMPFLDNKEDHAFGVPVSTAMTSNLTCLPISGLEIRDLESLLAANTKFSGFPIVEDASSMMLVGYVGRTELRYALDRARRDQMAIPRTKCFFTPVAGHVPITPSTPNPSLHNDYLSATSSHSIDLSKFIDSTPITVHPRLPLETVMELFKKLGPRVILIEYRGRLTGLITVKDCLKYQFQAEAHENPKDDSALREAQDRLWEIMAKTARWLNGKIQRLKGGSTHVRLPSGSESGVTPRSDTSADGRAATGNGDVELEHRT